MIVSPYTSVTTWELCRLLAMDAVTMAEMEDVAMVVETMALDVEVATMMAINLQINEIIKTILK